MSRLTQKDYIKAEVMGTANIDAGWTTLQTLAATAAEEDRGATERALARRRAKIAERYIKQQHTNTGDGI